MSAAAAPAPGRGANPIAVLVRVMVITVAFGILGGGLGALMGILGVTIINLAGQQTDMGIVLFVGAVPGFVIGAAVGLTVIVSSERRAAR